MVPITHGETLWVNRRATEKLACSGNVDKSSEVKRAKRYPGGTGTARTRIRRLGFMTGDFLRRHRTPWKGVGPLGEIGPLGDRKRKRILIAKPAIPKQCQRFCDPGDLWRTALPWRSCDWPWTLGRESIHGAPFKSRRNLHESRGKSARCMTRDQRLRLFSGLQLLFQNCG